MPDLIALADLQTITGLNDLVELKKTSQGIEDAHLEVEKVLGRTGYALVYANAPLFAAQGADSAAYVTLLNSYIKPFMSWRARQYSLTDQFAGVERAGVFVKSGNDYRSVGSNELMVMQAQYAARADMRLERLLNHLEENKTTFTWFETNVNDEERINKDNTTGPSGISFRRASGQDTYRG